MFGRAWQTCREASKLLRCSRSTGISCRAASSFTSLPIIDVSALVQPNQSAAAKEAVAAQLHAACRDVGFFYVKNTGIPAALQQGILQQARAWFALPDDVKDEISIRPDTHFRGYQRLGANVTRYDGGFQRDWHEAIDLYREAPVQVSWSDCPCVDAPGVITNSTGRTAKLQHDLWTAMPQAAGRLSSPIHGPNQWPVQQPEFDALLRRYLNSMLGLGSALMRGIALGLLLKENYFDAKRASPADSYWCARVIHYPPLTEGTYHRTGQPSASLGASAATSSNTGSGGYGLGPESLQSHRGVSSSAHAAGEAAAAEGRLADAALAALGGAEVDRAVQLSCGEHTDYGLLTLVNQEDHVTALQVKNAHGQWIPATPIPGTFVCNIGDMLKVWTNGLYQPTAHRVINADPSQSRVSIPFFYEPAFETLVKPLPQLRTVTGRPKYPAICYGTHLENKVLNNFEL